MEKSQPPNAEYSAESAGVLLLVPSDAAAKRISAALADRYAAHHMRLQVSDGAPAEVVPNLRQRIGGAPIGFVAVDEVAALDALQHGADEVLVWPVTDDAAIHGFFDRTRLRASIRKGQELMRASIVHSEKLSALGTLVAGVAHEINNPLMALQLSIEACLSSIAPLSQAMGELEQWAVRGSGATPEQVARLSARAEASVRGEALGLLGEMLAASTAIASVVKDLRVFARSDHEAEEPRVLEPNEVVDQAIRLVGREIAMAAHIERDYSRAVPRVVVPHGRLTQVLVNILINAAHAINDVPREIHRVRVTTRADTEYVAISISDTGPGIPPEALSQIFDPFFTTKRAGLGTGLGLSISRSIMRELGGDLIVESVHGSGATFIVLLPVPDPNALREAYLRQPGVSARPAPPQRQTVLVVDDDERVLKAYARMLGSSCDVLMARDAEEAIALLCSGSSVDTVVSELSLPELDGKQFFEWLTRERPRLAARTVFVTAHHTRERQAAFVGELENTVLTKPVSAAELWSALSAVGTLKSGADSKR